MRNIYKTILNVILEPICEVGPSSLRDAVERLKGHDLRQMRAVGEMLERAMRHIGYTIALSAEIKGEEYPADLEDWLGVEVRRIDP